MTTVQWRDLTLTTGEGADFRITELTGWEELPPARYDKANRSRAHGSHPSPVWADERVVTVSGYCWTAADRDALLAQFRAATPFRGDSALEDLTIDVAGRSLTGKAQLLRAAPALVKGQWGVGRFGFVAQWRCPDPLRYGPTVTVSTALPTDGGGLDYGTEGTGLAYSLDYGDPGNQGRVTVTNDGTADAPLALRITGPLLNGWEATLVETGDRLRWVGALTAGQFLVVDTADGSVLLNGTADRRAQLVVAEWFTVPPGETRTVAFSTLGGFDAAATLAADSAAAHW